MGKFVLHCMALCLRRHFLCNYIGTAVTASNFHNLSIKNMVPVGIILKSALMFKGVFQKSISVDSGGLMGNTVVIIH
jgi:hypothetical protein